MGSAWIGLVGAVIGGLVSLMGTLITSRFQWRQEKARMIEQRERDLLQWKEQRESDAGKWERDREDELFRWLREQKLKCYLEALDHLKSASKLSANAPSTKEGERRYAREDEMAIVQELRNSYRSMNSVRAVCGEAVTAKVNNLSRDLYFIIQSVSYEGIKPGEMVRLPPSSSLGE